MVVIYNLTSDQNSEETPEKSFSNDSEELVVKIIS
jgi:hypothetical protein